MTDPYRVEPSEHRGADTGILSLLFRLRSHRAENDHTGPARIEPRRRPQ